jgi:hypothetical protein
VAGCIIGFGITLKHKRQKISVENLIASLDVEKKAGAKNTIERRGTIWCRETHMARTKERINLSMPD